MAGKAKSAMRVKRVTSPKVSKPKSRGFFRRLGFRAQGGPVRAEQPVVVGERGPELFIPKSPGTIQTIPGGLGRAALISRAPGRGFAALNGAKSKYGSGAKKAIVGAVAGLGAFAVKEVLDMAQVSDVWQGGIFAGIAVGLAVAGHLAVAAGVGAIALYELGGTVWGWVKSSFPSLANLVPGQTAPSAPAGSATPPPTQAPAAAS